MKAAQGLLLILVVTSAASAAEVADCRLAPGWEQQGGSRTFNADNLFEYMDGDAEGYLIYDFLEMQNLTCKSGDDTVVIDVSRMSNWEGAYGLFLARLDPRQPIAPIGMGGQIRAQRAAFCKGAYYVELSATPEKNHTPALQAFVTAIANRISGRSTPPEALSWFPTEKLVSLRLVPESVLGLRALKRGYVAQYAEGKAFVVMEESPASAGALFNQLRARFADAASAPIADKAFEARDKYLGALCLFRKGRYLAGYANLTNASEACALARTLASRLPWN
jgi:hypothetical protein